MTENSALSSGQQLVVLLHGFRGNNQSFADIIDLAKAAFPGAILHKPELPHGRTFARIRAAKIVADQIAEITKLCEQNEFSDIVLMGHSMGAVMARRILLEASGLDKHWHGSENVGEPGSDNALCVEPEFAQTKRYKWVNRVSRLVLLAGMSRGWSIDNAKGGLQQFYWTLGSFIGHAMPGAKPTIFDIRKGCPFIVQTRLRWLDYVRSSGKKPQVVQLLGTVDQMVSPNDSVDYADISHSDQFILAEVPHTGHADVVKLRPGRGVYQTQEICQLRRDIIHAAMTGDQKLLSEYAIPRDYLDDELPLAPDPEVEDVLFVIHGIRDKGYWTKKIAARVKAVASGLGKRFVSRTPSYGYFPILPFLLPWHRRKKVEWLMDQYVESRTSYPDADFHYMGHSNGTYLCARALLDYPAVSFRRIMFAGSVVRPDYPWKQLVNGGRVDKIYNAVATKDVVVALFPHGLRWFKGFFDLGGAGHQGFHEKGLDYALFQLDYPSGSDSARKYVIGGHSSAKQESQWDEIADFIVKAKNPPAQNDDFASRQPWWSRLLGWAAPGIVLMIGAFLLMLFVFLLAPIVYKLIPGILIRVLPNMPDAMYPYWSVWINLSAIIHVFWMSVYVFVLRFIMLRF